MTQSNNHRKRGRTQSTSASQQPEQEDEVEGRKVSQKRNSKQKALKTKDSKVENAELSDAEPKDAASEDGDAEDEAGVRPPKKQRLCGNKWCRQSGHIKTKCPQQTRPAAWRTPVKVRKPRKKRTKKTVGAKYPGTADAWQTGGPIGKILLVAIDVEHTGQAAG